MICSSVRITVNNKEFWSMQPILYFNNNLTKLLISVLTLPSPDYNNYYQVIITVIIIDDAMDAQEERFRCVQVFL